MCNEPGLFDRRLQSLVCAFFSFHSVNLVWAHGYECARMWTPTKDWQSGRVSDSAICRQAPVLLADVAGMYWPSVPSSCLIRRLYHSPASASNVPLLIFHATYARLA